MNLLTFVSYYIQPVFNVTNGTVRNYLSSAIQKFEAESRFHAIRIADEKGWL